MKQFYKPKSNKTISAKWASMVPYYVLLLPFLLFYIVFMIIPIFSSVALSFTDFNMVSLPHFVGANNYIRMFTEDPVFMTALKNTIIFAIVIGPVGYILSFVMAWLINETPKSIRSILTLIVYSPVLSGNIYFIWQYIFSSDSRGFLNNFLIQLGILRDPISWLSDTKYNFTVCIIVALWMNFGSGFLSFIAGLQSLDPSYYEAAAIDGLKNRWQEMFYVTFPQMGPQLLFGAVMSISSAFAVGAVNAALTGNPSTNYSTHTILLHMTDYGSVRFEMGYASALAVVLFAIMLLSWLLINKLLSRYSAE